MTSHENDPMRKWLRYDDTNQTLLCDFILKRDIESIKRTLIEFHTKFPITQSPDQHDHSIQWTLALYTPFIRFIRILCLCDDDNDDLPLLISILDIFRAFGSLSQLPLDLSGGRDTSYAIIGNILLGYQHSIDEIEKPSSPRVKAPIFAVKSSYLLHILGTYGANIASIESPHDKYTLLHTSTHPKITSVLLQFKANPSVKHPQTHLTPLHMSPSIDIASILINAKADINAIDNHQSSPLHMAHLSDTARYFTASKVSSLSTKTTKTLGDVVSLPDWDTIRQEPWCLLPLFDQISDSYNNNNINIDNDNSNNTNTHNKVNNDDISPSSPSQVNNKRKYSASDPIDCNTITLNHHHRHHHRRPGADSQCYPDETSTDINDKYHRPAPPIIPYYPSESDMSHYYYNTIMSDDGPSSSSLTPHVKIDGRSSSLQSSSSSPQTPSTLTELLLSYGADYTSCDDVGRTPLCKPTSTDALYSLLNYNADPNQCDKKGRLPCYLHLGADIQRLMGSISTSLSQNKPSWKQRIGRYASSAIGGSSSSSSQPVFAPPSSLPLFVFISAIAHPSLFVQVLTNIACIPDIYNTILGPCSPNASIRERRYTAVLPAPLAAGAQAPGPAPPPPTVVIQQPVLPLLSPAVNPIPSYCHNISSPSSSSLILPPPEQLLLAPVTQFHLLSVLLYLFIQHGSGPFSPSATNLNTALLFDPNDLTDIATLAEYFPSSLALLVDSGTIMLNRVQYNAYFPNHRCM